ncbi:META domain-containing protein [Leucobacter sp. HY1910]
MTPSRLRIIAAAAAVAALALTGCSASGDASVVGSWGNTAQEKEPSLEFAEDGNVTGTDGCNRLMGSYTEDAGVVKFGQLASTMMFCEGVDTWLGQAATGKVSGDTITISDEAGKEIGTLKRTAD